MANDPNTIQYVIQEDGFWYVASKEKNPYVPYITVSAKGVANGLSTEYNDGYDFGPDSYDPNSTASIPYTQTSGIQEAYNYAISIAVENVYGTYEMPVILLREGDYYINEPFTVSGGSKTIHSCTIRGSGFDNTRLIANVSDAYAITYDQTTFAGGVDTIQDLGWYFPSTSAYGMFNIDLGTTYNSALNLINIENGNPSGQYQSYFTGFEFIYAENLQTEGTSGTYFQASSAVTVRGGFGSANTTVFIDGGGSHFVSGVGGLTELGNPSHLIADNCGKITLSGTNSSIIVLIRGGGNTINVNQDIEYMSIKGRALYQSYLLQNTTATTYTISYLIAKFIHNAGGGSVLSGSIDIGYVDWNVNDFSTPASTQPSTPSVPTSGTAQENTNPYPVDVYIYGGDVTEIQITRGGTAYTVLSVSTAIAMSGQSYRLNPGDSITLTYSTAPSWEWLSD
jgi:hypothetical protein